MLMALWVPPTLIGSDDQTNSAFSYFTSLSCAFPGAVCVCAHAHVYAIMSRVEMHAYAPTDPRGHFEALQSREGVPVCSLHSPKEVSLPGDCTACSARVCISRRPQRLCTRAWKGEALSVSLRD